jgi:hypothetical protein
MNDGRKTKPFHTTGIKQQCNGVYQLMPTRGNSIWKKDERQGTVCTSLLEIVFKWGTTNEEKKMDDLPFGIGGCPWFMRLRAK